MPNIVKIGLTSYLPEDRAKQLFNTAVPTPFDVAFRILTSHPKEVENKAHELLSPYRVNKSREFFEVPVELAIEQVRLAAVKASGIAKWNSESIHKIRSGDRIALSLEEGQLFALSANPNIFSEKADILDLWQSHSSGDLLELYAVNSASHVSGFSEYDVNSDTDPVPFLNRDNSSLNGMMNGREKMVPGDRLTWVPSLGSKSLQNSTIFEADCYVQIISRTWSPQTGPHNMPLLLNDFLYESPWKEAHNSIYNTLQLPMPNSWAPRNTRSSEWEEFATQSKPPEYWLPQLQVKNKKIKS